MLCHIAELEVRMEKMTLKEHACTGNVHPGVKPIRMSRGLENGKENRIVLSTRSGAVVVEGLKNIDGVPPANLTPTLLVGEIAFGGGAT